jgi:hypothetical protein
MHLAADRECQFGHPHRAVRQRLDRREGRRPHAGLKSDCGRAKTGNGFVSKNRRQASLDPVIQTFRAICPTDADPVAIIGKHTGPRLRPGGTAG